VTRSKSDGAEDQKIQSALRKVDTLFCHASLCTSTGDRISHLLSKCKGNI
jgi:hypothetical protein